jgi:UV DNA damage endonuclease
MKFGFCCLWETGDGLPFLSNQSTTTVKHFRTLTEREQVDKLNTLVQKNVDALHAMVQHLATLPPELRMFRIGSDVYPLYTHEVANGHYTSGRVDNQVQRLFEIGSFARANGVRLSFHPGQYTILQSKTAGVVERGVAEFEYHALVAERMGYQKWHEDGFAINIHMGGAAPDCKGFRSTFANLSDTAKNLITIENDEFSWSTDKLVNEIGDLCPIVIDVHHHSLNELRDIESTDLLVECVRTTWRGVRPKIHVAVSGQDLITKPHQNAVRLDYKQIVHEGGKKSELRGHSGRPWHTGTIDYWLTFAENFDLMFEGKQKNLGQVDIYNRWLETR